MTALSTLPVYAPPARETQVIFTLTEAATNFVRVWVTVAPPDSELRSKLEESTQSRFEIYTGPGGSEVPMRRKFDKGGKYTLVAQEYRRGASDYGGGYQGSPAGDPSETKVGSEATISLFIGQRMTSEIGANGDTATLVCWIWDGTIRPTSVGVHGEVTPALVNDSPTAKARAAMESTSVVALVDALSNMTVDDATSGHDSHISDFILNWNAHVADATVHQDADTDNDIPTGLGSVGAGPAAKEAVQEIILRMRNHFLNDASLGQVVTGRDSGDYHNVSGKKNDNANLPIVAGVGDADAQWGIAEIHRCYEAHRVLATVHDTPDTTNVAGLLSPLLQIASAFNGVLASASPTTPPAQSSGAMKMIARVGFSETPL